MKPPIPASFDVGDVKIGMSLPELQEMMLQTARQTMYFARTKNGEPRTVVMHERVYEAVYAIWKDREEPESGHGFPSVVEAVQWIRLATNIERPSISLAEMLGSRCQVATNSDAAVS